jgi:hypothetical protein
MTITFRAASMHVRQDEDHALLGLSDHNAFPTHYLAIRVDRRTCPALPDTEFVVELDGNIERMGKIADLLRRILGDAARLTISAA